jgi:mannosyltransferase
MSGDGLAMPSHGGAAQAMPVPAGPAQYEPSKGVRRPALTLRPAWLQAVPPLVTFAVALWGITGSSYWRDEAASLSAAERPLGNLVRMLGHVDAVHGAYYVIIWAVVRIGGAGELATRLPSALAMAAAAAAVTALGRRLVSPRAGLAAGLVFAILPEVSWYGQEARSYAMVTALAAFATYLLVRALQAAGRVGGAAGGAGEAAGGAGAGRWLAGYGAVLAVLGVANLFGLLLIVPHAVTVGLACRRSASDREPSGRGAARSLARGWLTAAAAAVLLVSPLMALAWVQRGQLAWLSQAGLAGLESLQLLVGTTAMTIAAGTVLACAVAFCARRGPERLAAAWPRGLTGLAVPWLVLPPAILLAVSPVTPIYAFRYVMICTPAVALLLGTGLAALGRAAGALAFVLIAALGLPFQLFIRSPGGHGDAILQADRIVAANMRPGDAVLEFKQENFAQAYPFGIHDLDNVAQARTPVQSATLIGTFLPDPVLRQRLTRVSRVWVVEYGHREPLPVLSGLRFRLVRAWQTSDIWLFLYAGTSR